MEEATFGAGCFWGVEAAFRKTPGVTATTVGYSGGTTDNPTYEHVCTGLTQHAEVVHVEYSPAEISYDELLEVFWASHNPTQLNRQGPDTGTQYRSIIFVHNDHQKELAEKSKAKLETMNVHDTPIVTLIEPAGPYYLAEEYHQQYLEKRGLASCHLPTSSES